MLQNIIEIKFLVSLNSQAPSTSRPFGKQSHLRGGDK